MPSTNVLITAASRRVPLVRAFRAALASLGLEGRVIATDVNPLSPAVHVADAWYLVPMADEPAYVPALLDVCEAERISLVVPTIDDELERLASAAPEFARRGACIAVSPASTNRLCADKFVTCRSLRARGISAAETFLPANLPEAPTFPLFVKPRAGRGGVSAFAARTRNELEFFLGYVPDPVVQEYLDGPEFTVDMLCDFHGIPLSIVPRERVVIRAGVIDRGRTVADARLIEMARSVANAFPFVGPVNIQCRIVGGRPVVFEINPRFSGGIPLTIAAGADFPRLLLELALGRPVQPSVGDFRPELWMTSYESVMYLDLARVEPTRLPASVASGEAA